MFLGASHPPGCYKVSQRWHVPDFSGEAQCAICVACDVRDVDNYTDSWGEPLDFHCICSNRWACRPTVVSGDRVQPVTQNDRQRSPGIHQHKVSGTKTFFDSVKIAICRANQSYPEETKK